jgi:hypothetical protein
LLFSGTAKLSHQLILRRDNQSVGQQDYLNMEAILDAHGPDIQRLHPLTSLSYKKDSPINRIDSFRVSWDLSHLLSDETPPKDNQQSEFAQIPFKDGQPLDETELFPRMVRYFVGTGKRLQPFVQDAHALPKNVKIHQRLVKIAIAKNAFDYRQHLKLDLFGILPAVQYVNDLQQVLKGQKNQWDWLPESVQIVTDLSTNYLKSEVVNHNTGFGLTPNIDPTLLSLKQKLREKHKAVQARFPSNLKNSLSSFQGESLLFNDVFIRFTDRNGEDVKLLLGKMPIGLSHQGYTAEDQQEMVPLATIDAFYKACLENALQWVKILKPQGWQSVADASLRDKEV